MEKISCSKPLEQYLSHQAEINSAVTRVLTNGNYILGAEVKIISKKVFKISRNKSHHRCGKWNGCFIFDITCI